VTVTLLRADARALPLPDASVDLIVTSPPYWALRSYTDAGEHYDGQIGAEPTPAAYIDSLIDCTREWMRVLKPTGSMWINLGDKYAGAAVGVVALGLTRPPPASRQGWRQGAPAQGAAGLPRSP
jgi:DNA modification methylase